MFGSGTTGIRKPRAGAGRVCDPALRACPAGLAKPHSRVFCIYRCTCRASDRMIEVQSLTRYFGPIRAVDGISFAVGKGEVLGFLGPNGAGKSTTMKMITGFVPPTSGTAIVCGHDIRTAPIAAKARIGYLPEGAPLYADMTARGFLKFVGASRGLGGTARAKAIDRVVEMAQLDTVLDQPIETLSKGFTRRVGLAQALLHDPEVLILDEPTDGLDPNQKHHVRQVINDMAPDKAIVISTHILEEVHAVCSRATIIAHGRLLIDGTPAELEARARHHNTVTVRTRALPPAAERNGLGRLDGVLRVEESGQPGAPVFRVIPRDGAAVLPAVSAFVTERRWNVDEMRLEQGRLDDVFRQLTAGDKGGGNGDMPGAGQEAAR